ncbi:MAG: phenylalanine--tRNA ligase subunit beta [Cyclobacteriaceae bacterium]|nr:phenylalanine--tRNA ligase subunit beta [Cyclobacteriaceae bacterium]
MKISLNWLKEYIDIQETPEELSHLLTMTGLEVETIEKVETVPGGLRGVVIAEIIECGKHPNADKLSITKVDAGELHLLPIVCGAPNVAVGQKVLVATVGTTLYPQQGGEFVIKKAKIRGEVSEGMICAEDELGMGNSHEGIMVLATDLPNGTPASTYFNMEDDIIFEIGLTPNRADATSHLGVARDIRAVSGRDIKWPNVSAFKVDHHSSNIRVAVEEADGCPRYSGVSISNLIIRESPYWLKNRLLAIGQEPVNNVVDATNFVLHELGQPLHAFDADKIQGRKVIVKTLPEQTNFVTLDQKPRKLYAGDLMICDEQGGMCIAGIFGGYESGITESTTNIFLESAYFSPDYIRKTSLLHGLKTDAAFRFERGTDPHLTVYALQRAAMLIKELAGGEISSDIVDIYPEAIMPVKVPMKFKYIQRLIGKALDENTIFDILKRLDIATDEISKEGFVATVPPYRVDVTREADVIEEILRIYGYDNIELKENLSTDFLASFPEHTEDAIQLKAADLLISNGYFEISTNSLTKPQYAEKADFLEASESVVILNKLSEDLGVLRQSLVFSGLEVIAHNINRKQTNLKIFEFGTVYKKSGIGNYEEKKKISIWLSGKNHQETWIAPNKSVAFHDMSAIVYKLIQKYNAAAPTTKMLDEGLFGYGMSLSIDGNELAKLGLLNPKICKSHSIDQEVYYAEIDFALLSSVMTKSFTVSEISKFPEVRRDLSLVIDKSVTFEQIGQIVSDQEFAGILKDINVFDYYVGEKIEKDKKAYALNFILQDKNKTLTDQEIDRIMGRLMEKFESNLGAVIRK